VERSTGSPALARHHFRAGRRDLRVPADDVPLQGDDRRRALVSVGSTNFDNRSFQLNDEANLNVYDVDFAARQIAIFEDDRARSRRISLRGWQERPRAEKLLERATSLLGAQM
jgi:phosphatidylserine/phosphatidylglycerophosphate/cardiolipin synthase-like enzyme